MDLSQKDKVLIARGGSLNSAQPQLHLLIACAADPDHEISEAAASTLARLSDEQCAALLADPELADSVSRYFLDPSHVRMAALPALLANPAVPDEAVTKLAATAGEDVIVVLLEHLDLLKRPALEALKQNPSATGSLERPLPAIPSSTEEKLAMVAAFRRLPPQDRLPILVALAGDGDSGVSDAAHEALQRIPSEECLDLLIPPSLPAAVARYYLEPTQARPSLLPLLLAHPSSPQDAITNLAAEAEPEALTVLLEQLDLLRTPALRALKENQAYLHWQVEPPPQGYVIEVDLLDLLIQEVDAETPFAAVGPLDPDDKESESVFKKVAKMSVAKRVVLALRGNREERAILIRDGSKVVTRAVMSSPKLTESEIETFAALKNVSQDVLRLISMNRKFMKNYVVMKNLVFNPRLPIDIGLGLLNRLLPQDLRGLSSNRDVSDTIRKMADRAVKTRER